MSLLLEKPATPFQRQAKILFEKNGPVTVVSNDFRFFSGTLKKDKIVVNGKETTGGLVDNSPQVIPLFSILAVLVVIIFRNLNFQAFQKYFVRPVNNFEIDFNFQKIGVTPLVLGLLIIFFSFSGLFSTPFDDFPFHQKKFIETFRMPFLILSYPLLVSTVSLFLLSLTGKFFPLFFSDIKAFFGLSLIILVWNFLDFGTDIEQLIPLKHLIIGLGFSFFTIRSFLFFQVLRRAYRFRLPLTLFYICTLNLATFLLLFRVMRSDYL